MKEWMVSMNICYIVLQWTWGIIQNLLGSTLLLTMWMRKQMIRMESYHSACVCHWRRRDSVALGMFIFFGHGNRPEAERMLSHEYGHTLQSMMLGPFYLPMIGLPSYLWANHGRINQIWKSGKCSYFDFYTERWADRLGGVSRKNERKKGGV